MADSPKPVSDPKATSLNGVRLYFGIPSASAFGAEWRKLSDQDKADLKNGIGNGTETY